MFILIVFVVVSAGLWSWWLRVIRNGSGHILSGTIPIIGYTHKLIGNTEKLWDVLKGVSNQSLANDGVTRTISAMQTYYVITDPEDLTTVGNSCLQKHFAFDFSKPWLGNGLITSDVSTWKRHRKLINPAFTLQLLLGYLDLFNAQARELVESLASTADKGPMDISSYFRENAMKTLSQTALGISREEKPNFFQKYMEAADELLELIALRFQNFWLQSNLVYKLVGLKKKETDLIKVLSKMSDVIIKEKKSELGNISDASKRISTSGLKYKAFLDLLLELNENNTLSDEEIREEVDTIIIAGTDTSSWVVTYTCAALGTYPDIQEKVFVELTEVFGDSNRDVNKDDLQRLVYIEAVIKETLRLYPVVPASLRTVKSGVQLRNNYLRPGDHIIMSFYGVNRHPIWGPTAEQFRPERWFESETLPNVYGGFGIGKRSCIGKTFAMISMKILLVHVLRRYRLSGDATQLKFKTDFINKPVAGHLIALSERNNNIKIQKPA